MYLNSNIYHIVRYITQSKYLECNMSSNKFKFPAMFAATQPHVRYIHYLQIYEGTCILSREIIFLSL